jgi:hypothetical protein
MESVISTVLLVGAHMERWRDPAMVHRWVGTQMIEAQRSFRRIKGYKEMKPLVDAVRAEVARRPARRGGRRHSDTRQVRSGYSLNNCGPSPKSHRTGDILLEQRGMRYAIEHSNLPRLHRTYSLGTGAGQGMGASHAKRFASAGAQVGCLDVNLDAVQHVVESITAAGGKATAVQTNVTDWQALCRARDELLRKLGPVDIVVANAGILGSTENAVDMSLKR